MSDPKCERCGENAAQIHYTEVRDGQAEQLHICAQCARELGFETQPGASSLTADPLALAGKLFGVVSVGDESAASPHDTEFTPSDERVCPECRVRAAELAKRPLFGCPACYETFRDSLDRVFHRVHGATHHRGRGPRGTTVDPVDVSELRRRLQEAVSNEDFEEAARVRDQLRRAEPAGEPPPEDSEPS